MKISAGTGIGFFYAVAAVAAAALVTGCAGGTNVLGGAPALQAPILAPVPAVTTAERVFMTRAIGKTQYELEVSRLAAQRASDPRVRSYAQNMVERQTQMTGELISVMSMKGVPVPKGLPPEQAGKLRKLAALPPSAAFDQGYVRVVGIEDHQSNIAMLEQGRRIAGDRDLRAWIDRTLPALRRQLSIAENLAGSIAG